MFAQKSLKENEKKSLKRALNGMEFICGTSFQEFVMDAKNEDINVLDKVFVRENLSCMSIVEKPYFSCEFLKKVCIHCGSSKNVTTSVDSYPKCNKQRCKKEESVLKKKPALAADLAPASKKKT